MCEITKSNKYFKVFLVIYLFVYFAAIIYLIEKPCALYSIENCELHGYLGMACVIVWSQMITVSMYFLYLTIYSLRFGVYSSDKLLLVYYTKPVTGRKLYVYCSCFISASMMLLITPILWWNSIVNTVSEYNILFP